MTSPNVPTYLPILKDEGTTDIVFQIIDCTTFTPYRFLSIVGFLKRYTLLLLLWNRKEVAVTAMRWNTFWKSNHDSYFHVPLFLPNISYLWNVY